MTCTALLQLLLDTLWNELRGDEGEGAQKWHYEVQYFTTAKKGYLVDEPGRPWGRALPGSSYQWWQYLIYHHLGLLWHVEVAAHDLYTAQQQLGPVVYQHSSTGSSSNNNNPVEGHRLLLLLPVRGNGGYSCSRGSSPYNHAEGDILCGLWGVPQTYHYSAIFTDKLYFLRTLPTISIILTVVKARRCQQSITIANGRGV